AMAFHRSSCQILLLLRCLPPKPPNNRAQSVVEQLQMNVTLNPIRSLLLEQTTLFLATVSPDDEPRSTPLFYIADKDFNLYWFSSRTSLHSRNCQHSPEVSVAISSDARTWKQIKGIQMQGRVSIVADRALRKTVTLAYVKHFQLGNLFTIAIRR